ncbi:LrgB family protein [Halomonas elongata]|uniref:CidB family protein n=2 Tax=Halomonas elongata TaxID=2746 RepID=E1VCN0_HALED|nr:LrgB family protein [Halomonas elongata]MBW5800821.1 LrgB family protein [Halomonas elongata]OBX36492.1 inner membrane protein YohK [Halomonas elongata]RAW08873.1 LrgB family protein [Halomonas elongata]WBF19670.1 LrgB family protein [Halomonas elongata]WPU48535.1 LrgB family protein [Halomonas elongata DSM 2581]
MNVAALDQLWVYLSGNPLLSLLVTLLAFMIAVRLNRALGGTPLLHPVTLSIAILIGFLLLVDMDYATYFEGAQFIHFLLGPATVALAIPLYDHRERVRRLLGPLLLACIAGILTAVTSTVGLALLFGVRQETLLSLAPRSVTSPIAMGIAEQIGGIPSLAAGLVLLTGSIGCALGPAIFRLLKITDPAVQGFTMGLSAHGFGTAHSFARLGAVAGAFSGLSMGLTGLLTAFLLPLITRLLGLS